MVSKVVIGLELCVGSTLKELVQEISTCYSWLKVVIKVAEGMKALHERNIMHRDLKLENIMVCIYYNIYISKAILALQYIIMLNIGFKNR